MADIYGNNQANRLIGTNNKDYIYGGDGNDFLDGQGGDDFLDGQLGDDTLLGGAGNDTFSSYYGNDVIDGGTGSDYVTLLFDNSTTNITYTAFDALNNSGTITDGAGRSLTYSSVESFYLRGGSGNDDLRGGSGNDKIFGQAGNDTLTGGIGNDSLYGDVGNDSLNGGDGNDLLGAYTGNNTLIGGNGDDIFSFTEGNNIVDGGAGSDTLSIDYYYSSTNITYTAFDPVASSGTFKDSSGRSVTYTSVEIFKLLGGEGNDDLRGSSGNDRLEGRGGNNTLTGGAGDDSLTTGGRSGISGNDSLSGGAGNDRLGSGIGIDIVDGGDGNDTLGGGSLFSTQANEVDTLTGGAGKDFFSLGAFNQDVGRTVNAYDDQNNSTSGLGNYGLIKDFNPLEDTIGLAASGNSSIPSASQYVLGSSPIAGTSGTALYFNTDSAAGVGSTDELLAVLQGTSNLSLTDSYFNYVVTAPTPIIGG
jgi:Ca2+-binding RTX toxin-like protein